jgi:endonuclease/exonuclease/phosphatase family metal-dependent hydrolase
MRGFAVKSFRVLFLILFVQGLWAENLKPSEVYKNREIPVLKIASFNIQIFGRTKAARPNTLSVLAEIALNFDIIALQEVGSNRSSASDETCAEIMEIYVARINEIAGEEIYSYINGNQYAIVYRTDRVRVKNYMLYDGIESFTYTPLIANFETVEDGSNFDFSIITVHTSPGRAEDEIPALKKVMSEVEKLYEEPDVLCLGDFNADGSYYDEGPGEWLRGFDPEFYITGIPNYYDTTVAPSDNTYDRMQMTRSFDTDFTGESGVMRFDEIYDLSGCEGTERTEGQARAVSDHYPVWCEYYIDRDED